MTQTFPPLVLPPGLAGATAALQDKDRRRLDDTVTRLHTVNGRLWDTEDRVRGALLTAAQVADCKREIDQLNAERNALAERADEILGTFADAGRADAALHTETLASVVDRLSVLTLRIWHSERASARDELARRRVPALHRQREELCAALDTLIADVVAGRRRLPVPARFKLYGRDDAVLAEIEPSRHLRRVSRLRRAERVRQEHQRRVRPEYVRCPAPQDRLPAAAGGAPRGARRPVRAVGPAPGRADAR